MLHVGMRVVGRRLLLGGTDVDRFYQFAECDEVVSASFVGDTGDGAEDGESNEDENMDPQPDSRAIEEEDDSGDDDESDSSDGEDQHRVENHEEDSSDDDDEDELPDKSGMEMDQSPDDRHLELTSSKICRIFSLHSLL